MAWPQRRSKPKAHYTPKGGFPSSSELLTVRLPVEKMDTKMTPLRIIEKDALTGTATAIAQHMPTARSLLLVCDDNTWVAAGERLHTTLRPEHTITPHSLGRHANATLKSAQEIAAQAIAYDGLLAVGSGTINDITKYAAALAKKPYLVIATAASMNGYSSANASLEEDGFKHSFPATTPCAVLADTSVIATAPKRLTRAGLGDTLCRSTVEADMLLSHHLFGSPYPRDLFNTMRSHEAALIASAAATREGDETFIAKLMLALLDAGDAMTAHGSSAPASQSEHMIAHTLEMMYRGEFRNVLHGEMVALTTLTMNQLQHKMLLGTPIVKALPREGDKILRLFGKKMSVSMAEQYEKKLLTPEQAIEVNAMIVKRWPEIKAEMLEIMTAPNSIERAFIHSGISTRAEEIGLSEERYRIACTYAYLTRDRFTFLDLAVMNDRRVS